MNIKSAMDTLPPGFIQTAEFNLRENAKLVLWLNIIGFVLFVFAALSVPVYIRYIRPQSAAGIFSFTINNLGEAGMIILVLLVDLIILVILHEGTHGLCFWLLTGKRPVYNIGPGYAYAAAPNVFLKKFPYIVTAVSPLVVLTVVGMVLLPIIPDRLVFHTALIMVMNIAGAVGDLWIVGMLITRREPLYIRDSGDKVEFFQIPYKPS